jgi:hypothetical protein
MQQTQSKYLLGGDSTVTENPSTHALTVAAEGEGLVVLPGGSPRWPVLLVSGALTTQATELLASRGETTKLSVLVHRLA